MQGDISMALTTLSTNLTYLDLGNNALSGALGSAPCSPPSSGLQALYLGSNLLNGSLPACLFSSGARQHLLCGAAVSLSRVLPHMHSSPVTKRDGWAYLPITLLPHALAEACPGYQYCAVRGGVRWCPSANLGCF